MILVQIESIWAPPLRVAGGVGYTTHALPLRAGGARLMRIGDIVCHLVCGSRLTPVRAAGRGSGTDQLPFRPPRADGESYGCSAH